VFLENFPKLPSGLEYLLGDLCALLLVSRFRPETAWRHERPTKQYNLFNSNFGFLYDPLGGDEHPSGHASKICLILMLWDFLDCFDQG